MPCAPKNLKTVRTAHLTVENQLETKMQPETRKLLKITDITAKKLEKLNLHTPWDLALHLPLRYEDETQITPIASAPIATPVQVQGTVIYQEVQFKPRKQLIARIQDDTGAVLNLRFIHFYPTHQNNSPKDKPSAHSAKSNTAIMATK